MKKADVKVIVEANVEKMAMALCLMAHWRIQVDYMKLEEGTTGQANIDLEYRRVYIKLDAAQHVNEEHVLDTLRHELLHVTFWPFHLYREHFTDVDAKGEKARREMQLWTFAVENLVANWEKILKCLEPDEFKFLKALEPPPEVS